MLHSAIYQTILPFYPPVYTLYSIRYHQQLQPFFLLCLCPRPRERIGLIICNFQQFYFIPFPLPQPHLPYTPFHPPSKTTLSPPLPPPFHHHPLLDKSYKKNLKSSIMPPRKNGHPYFCMVHTVICSLFPVISIAIWPCTYQGWELAHFAQIKWVTVNNSLRSLKTNERPLANRSGCSEEMSNRERIAQVAQYKWATMSN